MAWYQTRTDSELVELARGGDRRARAMLFDRTIRPASAVALHLTAGDREAAIPALITAYRLAFRRLHRLQDPDRFTHWLLRMIDDRAPFPVGMPADSEILTSFERDRVRRAVGLQTEAARRMARPMAVLIGLALVAVAVAIGSATLPSVRIADDPLGNPRTVVTDDPSPGRHPAVSSHEPTEVDTAEATADPTDPVTTASETTTPSPTQTSSEPTDGASEPDVLATEGSAGNDAGDDGDLADTR